MTATLAWLTAVAVLLVYEFWALKTDHRTLSRAMRNAFDAWPFFGVLVGLIAGILLAHFFWAWCPR